MEVAGKSVERAMEWLLAHADDPDPTPAAVDSADAAAASNSASGICEIINFYLNNINKSFYNV